MLHNKPPFCRARIGVMVILFPTFEPLRHLDDGRSAPPKKKSKKKKTRPRNRESFDFFAWPLVRYLYGKWEWRRRMASYGVKLSISSFSRDWARKRWSVKTELLHPPVGIFPDSAATKENRILSVGRFATTGHTKKQIEMLLAFRELRNDLPGWSYYSLGGLNESEQDRRYFETALAFAEPGRVEVRANIPRAQLQESYAAAKIFWHAAGLDDDLSAQPEMAEHFGLSTVEAMAHGCVPVVINLGGQREIVEHGVSGFLWNSLAEMKSFTRQLAAHPVLFKTMSAAARLRAQVFSREGCVANLLRFAGLT